MNDRVIHRERGDIPNLVRLPATDTGPRDLQLVMQEENERTKAFQKRVRAYLHGKLAYEEVW